MPKSLEESPLSKDATVSGGLKQFRILAQNATEIRDGPFGPPKSNKTHARPPQLQDSTPTNEGAPTMPASGRHEPPKALANTQLALAPSREEITLPVSLELRDCYEQLAKLLNRKRLVRKNRITRNSVMRVALESFLQDFSPTECPPINSEEELLKTVRERRRP